MKKIKLMGILIVFAIMFSSCLVKNDLDRYEEDSQNMTKNNSDAIMDKGQVRGGLVKLFSTIPDTLNPLFTRNIYVMDFSSLLYESLVKLDQSNFAKPYLADKWEVSPDGLTWYFHIKDNVLWHDGIPFTAEDVEFTLSIIANVAIDCNYKQNVRCIASFSVVDKSNLKIILSKPNAFLPEMMIFPILPKHYFAGEDILSSPKNMKPMGTGSYKYVEYLEKKHLKLTAVENWWNSTNSLNGEKSPYISSIEVKIFENSNMLVDAFNAGNIDVISLEPFKWSRFLGRRDISIRKFPSRNFEFLSINQDKSWFIDKVVRQSISFSLNKSELANEGSSGEAIPSDLPMIPNTWINDADNVFINTDVRKAQELLQNNEWKIEGPNYFKIINGYKKYLKLNLIVNNDNEVRSKMAFKIKTQLESNGIAVNVENLAWEEYMKRIGTRKYDLALVGINVPTWPDISYLYSTTDNKGFNISGYKNQNVDQLVEQIMNEPDPQKQRALFVQVKTIISDEVPYIGLYFANNAVIYNKKIKGNFFPNIFDKYSSLSNCYLSQ